MGSVVCSNELNVLLEALIERIKALPRSITKASIIIPDTLIRSWLISQCAARGISIVDLEIVLVEEVFERQHTLSPLAFLPLLTHFFEQEGHPEPVQQALLPFVIRAFFGESRWFAHKEREALWSRFIEWAEIKKRDLGLHVPTYLFGFSSINRAFFEQIASSTYFKELFLLSPCMLYWGDQCSDRKVRYLLNCAEGGSLSSKQHLETLLLDRQRFLANTGQMGQQCMLLIEDMDLPKQALYALPEPLFREPYQSHVSTDCISVPCTTPSLLDHLKADMLLLVGKREEAQDLPKDHSIEIHAAYTPLREVEALYERVGKGISLEPATVLVFVTDMARYRASFEQVFDCPYQIWGEEKRGGAVRLLKMMISLLSSKGRSQEWVQLLRHETFQKMLSFRPQDVDDCIVWLSKRPTWGVSTEHRRRYLEHRFLPTDSRQEGLSSLYDSYLNAFLQDLGRDRERLESSALQPLSAFFAFVQDVEERFSLPLEECEQRTMDEWEALFAHLVQRIVGAQGPGYEQEALLEALSEFERISTQASRASLLFSEVKRLFFSLIDKALSRRPIDLACPIIVAELGAVQPFPAELVALLGLEEDLFPMHDEDRLLSKLHRMVSASPITNVGIDRYGIVEAILAAKNLFIGYQSYNVERRKSYSPVIDEMVRYLDEQYRIDGSSPSKELIVQHPLYRAPKAKKGKRKKDKELYLQGQKRGFDIEVNALCRVAFSPLSSFFREQYALSSHWAREESLFVRSQDIRRSFIKGSVDGNGIRNECISKELEKIETDAAVYDLHLLPTVSSAHMDGLGIFCPPVHIKDAQTIVGSLSGIADTALMLFDEQWEQELFYRWPETVLRSFLSQHHGLDIAEKAYIVSESRFFALKLSDPKRSLERWSTFFSSATQAPFPFSYEIIQILLKDKEGLYRAIVDRAEREKEKGAWSVYANDLVPTLCEEQRSSWKEWAKALWDDYFVCMGGYNEF